MWGYFAVTSDAAPAGSRLPGRAPSGLRSRGIAITLIAGPCLSLAIATAAFGQATVTWQNGAADGSWTNPANWGGVAPVAGDNLLFTSAAGVATNPLNNDFATGTPFNSLQFVNATFSGPLTLRGNGVTLGAGGITNNNTSASRQVTIENAIAVSATQTWTTANSLNAVTLVSGSLSGSGSIAAAGHAASLVDAPAIRLSGSNAAHSGGIDARNAGVYLLSPAAMTGGNLNINNANAVAWIQGGAGQTYTFGIGTGANQIQFRTTGTGGLVLAGGNATWDPGNGADYTHANDSINTVGFATRTGETNRLDFGNSSSRFILAGAAKVIRGTNSPHVRFLSALGDDGTARNVTFGGGATSGPLLAELTRDASGGVLSGTTTVAGGVLSISGMNQIFSGNLALSGGVVVLNGVSWASFTANRSAGYGTNANQWQFAGTTSSGFAARGTPVTINDSQTTTATFDRNFSLGSNQRGSDGALYAEAAVTISRGIALTAARTITVRGANAESSTNWTVAGPVNEISGAITGSFPLTIDGNSATTGGGSIRLSNVNNTFNALNVGTSNGASGSVVVIATSDEAMGLGAVTVNAGAAGRAGLLLFENSEAGVKQFTRNVAIAQGIDNSAGDQGFGSYGGSVQYNGIATVTGNRTTLPVHVQTGTLSFGSGASIVNNSSGGSQAYHKGGGGELVLDGTVTYGGSNANIQWVLQQGTLATTKNGLLSNGTSPINLNQIFGSSSATGNGDSGSAIRQWSIRQESQTLTSPGSGTFSRNITVDVAANLTLTMNMGASTLMSRELTGSDEPGLNFWVSKTGAGTWTYANSATSQASGGRSNGAIRVQSGTFDVTGTMGRTGLWLDGGTILSGVYSPFVGGGSTPNRLQVTAAGGKLGISASAAGNVSRHNIPFDGTNNVWNLGGTGTIELAARGNWDLVFSGTTVMPALAMGETLVVTRDGAGTGRVHFSGNSSYTVNGTLKGSGALRIGSAGTGSLLVSAGTLSPGSSPGLLDLQANLTLAGTSASYFEIDGLTRGTQFDAVDLTGNISYGGALQVLFGFTPNVNDTFLLFNVTGTKTGNFGSLAMLNSGYAGSFDSSTGVLTVTAVPEPGTILLAAAAAVAAIGLRDRRPRSLHPSKTGRPRRVENPKLESRSQ